MSKIFPNGIPLNNYFSKDFLLKLIFLNLRCDVNLITSRY